MPGQEVDRFIDQEYYASGGFPPTLTDGTTYYFLAKIIDDEDRSCDPNSRNDSDSRSFTAPDWSPDLDDNKVVGRVHPDEAGNPA